jgi:hypothetical protein
MDWTPPKKEGTLNPCNDRRNDQKEVQEIFKSQGNDVMLLKKKNKRKGREL